MKGKIKIIVVDDHEIFRSGLNFVLNQHDKFEVIAEACNGKEFLMLLEKLKPDIVLIDIDMPEINEVESSK